MKVKAIHYRKYGKYQCEKMKLKITYDLIYCHFHYFLGCVCVCVSVMVFGSYPLFKSHCAYVTTFFPLLDFIW